MAIRKLVVVFSLSLAFVGLLIFAKPVSQILVASIWPQKLTIEKPIGQIKDIKGAAELLTPTSFIGRRLNSEDIILRHRDRITTLDGSSLIVVFDNAYELRIEPNTEVIFESWNTDAQLSPIYVSILSGDYSLLEAGRLGSVYIIQNKKLFAPELRPKLDPVKTIVTDLTAPNADPQSLIAKEAEALPETPEKSSPANSDINENLVGKAMPNKKNSTSLETQYIEDVLAARHTLFRRCRLTSLRDQKQITGNLLYTFIIQGNGNVQNVRLLQTDINNSGLQSCVASVIERTKFKSFGGDSISLSYPIHFD